MADISSFSKTLTSIASATYADTASPLTTTGTSLNLHAQQLAVQGGALGFCANGATVVVTVASLGAGGSVVFTLQGSVDNSNWFTLASASAITSNSTVAFSYGAPLPQYVRVRAVNTDGGDNPTAVLSASVIVGGK